MSETMNAALTQLNAVTKRFYAIQQDGDQYTLLIPTGGAYPPVDSYAMLVRLVTLTIAARGRGTR